MFVHKHIYSLHLLHMRSTRSSFRLTILQPGRKTVFSFLFFFIYTEKPEIWRRIVYRILLSLLSLNFLETMQKGLPITSVSPDVALRQKRPILRECKICGACAKYSYYGAIVCLSCKVFFRRNITEDLVSSPYAKAFFHGILSNLDQTKV